MESGHDGLQCISFNNEMMSASEGEGGRGGGEGGSHSARSVSPPLSLYDSYFGVTNNISETMNCVTEDL